MKTTYWVNTTDKTITEVSCHNLADLQKLVGGYIEAAYEWPTGDVLFVNEEGLLAAERAFFRVGDRDTPLAGNGVVVGPEADDDSGELTSPTITLAQLHAQIRFLSAAEVKAWAKAHSSEPMITFQGSDDAEPTIIARAGDLYGHKPGRS